MKLSFICCNLNVFSHLIVSMFAYLKCVLADYDNKVHSLFTDSMMQTSPLSNQFEMKIGS